MKTKEQINDTLQAFENTFGLSIREANQGSDEWFKAKLGVISASNASKVVAKKDSETRNTYMMELIAQICTGDQEEINSKYLEWGNTYEAAARSSYEFSTGSEITEVPFVFKNETFREGCSPDGIVDGKKGVEIKCPYNAVHYIKFLTEDKIKPEYVWQYQFALRVMGAAEMDFCQYHPNMKKSPLKILTVHADEEKQKTLEDAVPQFIHDMDKVLEKIGMKFGDQWKR
jgi:putative phage-type endonuclease